MQEKYLLGFDFSIGKKGMDIYWFNLIVLLMASGASFAPYSFLDVQLEQPAHLQRYCFCFFCGATAKLSFAHHSPLCDTLNSRVM